MIIEDKKMAIIININSLKKVLFDNIITTWCIIIVLSVKQCAVYSIYD